MTDMGARVVVGLLLFLAQLIVSPRAARADDLVTLLWLRSSGDDEALVRRVRAQVNDLPVQVVETMSARSSELPEQIRGADTLARQANASVVVWFEPITGRSSGVLVVVAQPAGGRILVRRLDSGAPIASLHEVDSATLESAALVVRTSLRALRAGGVIGISREELTPPAILPQRAPAQEPRIEASPRRATPPSFGVFADIGWQATGDGVTLENGVTVALGLAAGRWSFGIDGVVGFGTETVGTYASYVVSRNLVLGFVELAAVRVSDVSAFAGLDAGAVFFPRRTISTAAGVTSSPSALNAGFVGGPLVSFRWLPAALGHRVGPWVAIAGDIVPGAPTFGYQVGKTFEAGARTWSVESRAQLGLEVRAF